MGKRRDELLGGERQVYVQVHRRVVEGQCEALRAAELG